MIWEERQLDLGHYHTGSKSVEQNKVQSRVPWRVVMELGMLI